MVYYIDSEYNDIMLWYCMKEDFVGWTKEIWALVKKDVVRDFRNFLRENGVFVPMDGSAIGDNIQEQVINAEEEHKWTPQEIEHQLCTTKKFNSRWNPNDTPIETRSNSVAPGMSSYVPYPSLPPIQPAASTTSPQEQAQDPLASRFNNLRTLPQQDQVLRPTSSGSTSPLQPTKQSPPQPLMQFQRGLTPLGGTPKMLTELTKLYSDQEKKFGGELYDILNSKLRIFYDCCQKVGLEPDQYHNAYSVMLKGRASTFYYDRLAGKGYEFNRMIYETRCHFETEENKQQYMSEWRETTFPRIIATNPDVSRLDCLQKLFDRLQTIQRGLSESYQEDFSLRDQVISACRGVEECNLALFNPASTYEGVCAQLRSSIGTALRSREVQQFNTQL